MAGFGGRHDEAQTEGRKASRSTAARIGGVARRPRYRRRSAMSMYESSSAIYAAPAAEASPAFSLVIDALRYRPWQLDASTQQDRDRQSRFVLRADGVLDATRKRGRSQPNPQYSEASFDLPARNNLEARDPPCGLYLAVRAGMTTTSNQASPPSAPAPATLPPSFHTSPTQRGGHRPGRSSRSRADATLRPGLFHGDRSTLPTYRPHRPGRLCWCRMTHAIATRRATSVGARGGHR